MSFTIGTNQYRPLTNKEVDTLKQNIKKEVKNYVEVEIKLKELGESIETRKKNALKNKEESIQHKENSIKLKEESIQHKENSNRLKEESLQHKENSNRLKEESLQHKENSIKLKEESLQHKENSIKLKEESLQHKKNAEETRKKAQEVTFTVFCKILGCKLLEEERNDVFNNYLSAISFDRKAKTFELNMNTYVKYLENNEKRVGETLDLLVFKRISNIVDLANYSNKTEKCAFKAIKFTKEVKEDEDFKKAVKSFNKNVQIL